MLYNFSGLGPRTAKGFYKDLTKTLAVKIFDFHIACMRYWAEQGEAHIMAIVILMLLIVSLLFVARAGRQKGNTMRAAPRWLMWGQLAGWGLLLIPLIDHLLDMEDSLTAQLTWFLTIGPHEIGHLLCIPFGTLIMFAGGSIGQVLFWVGLGAYSLLYRRVGQALFFGMVAGHSFLNMSVYIRDAQERELDLLPGFTEDNHDWWNILNMTGLLRFDDMFANIAVMTGVVVVVGCIGLGVMSTLVHLQRG